MITILAILSSVLGIASSIITIVSFFNSFAKRYKLFLLIFVIISSSIAVYSWFEHKNNLENPKIEKIFKNDANSIARTIVLSGVEETGDFVGYLTQITSFYYRHREKFPTEYEVYKKQLDEWQEYLKSEREKGNIIRGYSSDLTEIKGLVSSGKKHLETLSK